MPDDIDAAQDAEALDRWISLTQKRAPGPAETGACLLCEEPMLPGRRWCDSFCRGRWEAEQDVMIGARRGPPVE
jgi:hypothetical protein